MENEFLPMENDFQTMERKSLPMERKLQTMEKEFLPMEKKLLAMEKKLLAMENEFLPMGNDFQAMERKPLARETKPKPMENNSRGGGKMPRTPAARVEIGGCPRFPPRSVQSSTAHWENGKLLWAISHRSRRTERHLRATPART